MPVATKLLRSALIFKIMFQNQFSQLVEIIVPANSTQTRIQFVDQPYLRNKKITALGIYSANDVPISPQGNAVATAGIVSTAFLTLYTTDPMNPSNQGQWIQQIPLWEFHTTQNAANDPYSNYKYYMAQQTIIWEKSYIELTVGIGSGDPTSFLLNVSFLNQLVTGTVNS
jgi:hypothetical protein